MSHRSVRFFPGKAYGKPHSQVGRSRRNRYPRSRNKRCVCKVPGVKEPTGAQPRGGRSAGRKSIPPREILFWPCILCASDLCLCILGMRRSVVGPRLGVLFETAIVAGQMLSGVLVGSA